MTLLCLLVAMEPVTMAQCFFDGIVVLATFAHPAVAGGKGGLLMTPFRLLVIATLPCNREVRLVTNPRLLGCSHPNRSFDSLDSGKIVVIPQDGGHGDRSGQVLDFVAIDGEDGLLLI